jgi:hypothetical protein
MQRIPGLGGFPVYSLQLKKIKSFDGDTVSRV